MSRASNSASGLSPSLDSEVWRVVIETGLATET